LIRVDLDRSNVTVTLKCYKVQIKGNINNNCAQCQILAEGGGSPRFAERLFWRNFLAVVGTGGPTYNIAQICEGEFGFGVSQSDLIP
jgi:hypothetical protein